MDYAETQEEKDLINARLRRLGLVTNTVKWLDNIKDELRTEQHVHEETGYQDILNDLEAQIAIAEERLTLRRNHNEEALRTAMRLRSESRPKCSCDAGELSPTKENFTVVETGARCRWCGKTWEGMVI